MIYLSGGDPGRVVEAARADLGVMLTPDMGNRPDLARVPWAADNGCFTGGDWFDEEGWLAWLESLAPWRETCLFAVLPDRVADAPDTWYRGGHPDVVRDVWLLGFRPAYVSQDGETHWPAGAAALFIGGSTDWKLCEASYALARRAKAAGLWVHMGRVNSFRRLKAAHLSGIDSADGTYVAFGPDQNLPTVLSWLDRLQGQPSLLGAA